MPSVGLRRSSRGGGWVGGPRRKASQAEPYGLDAGPATEGNTSGLEKGFHRVLGVVGPCGLRAGPEQTRAALGIASEQLTESQGRFTV